MVIPKKVNSDPIERLVLKLPKSLATYFRNTFAHGKRSEFIAKCILDYKHQIEIKEIENKLKAAIKKRQK
jgi:hypothetical protein